MHLYWTLYFKFYDIYECIFQRQDMYFLNIVFTLFMCLDFILEFK